MNSSLPRRWEPIRTLAALWTHAGIGRVFGTQMDPHLRGDDGEIGRLRHSCTSGLREALACDPADRVRLCGKSRADQWLPCRQARLPTKSACLFFFVCPDVSPSRRAASALTLSSIDATRIRQTFQAISRSTIAHEPRDMHSSPGAVLRPNRLAARVLIARQIFVPTDAHSSA